MAGLSLISLAGVTVLTEGIAGPVGQFAGIRNFIGFLGLSLLSGFLFGGRMAWVLPIASAFTAITLGNPDGNGVPWDWPVRVNGDFAAFGISAITVSIGLATLVAGTREKRGDSDT